MTRCAVNMRATRGPQGTIWKSTKVSVEGMEGGGEKTTNVNGAGDFVQNGTLVYCLLHNIAHCLFKYVKL